MLVKTIYYLQRDGGGGPVGAQPVRGDGHRPGGEQLGRVDAHARHLHPRRAHRLLRRHRHDLQRSQEGRHTTTQLTNSLDLLDLVILALFRIVSNWLTHCFKSTAYALALLSICTLIGSSQ